MQLIYWMPRSDGAAVGVLLERARWVADLTAVLPDTAPLSMSTRSNTDSAEAAGFTADSWMKRKELSIAGVTLLPASIHLWQHGRYLGR